MPKMHMYGKVSMRLDNMPQYIQKLSRSQWEVVL